jgi:subtilisin family serine protease
LARLRRHPNVEYVEPGTFANLTGGKDLRWGDLEMGCGVAPYNGPGSTIVAPGDLLPWNYRSMQIDSAWAYSSGRGVTIGIVDTGIDEAVPELNSQFSSGMSVGRILQKDATKPGSSHTNPWDDNCGHGTRMASVIAGPRNGVGTLGVAWGANLYAVRVDDDVVLSEVEATRLGIRRAAERARIVTMAFGTLAYYTSIQQELEYWFFNSDRLIFAAAGTYPCWDPWKPITFPGTLSTVQTVAAFDESGSLACNTARGYQVDFAARTNQPAQGLGVLGPILAGMAGSSGATAVMAGLSALYLSIHPTASRDAVLSSLIASASPAGGRSPLWGFGVPNAMCLVGQMCTAWIEGTNLIQSSGMYTWAVRQMRSPGPFQYSWSDGSASSTMSRYVSVTPGMLETSFLVSVTITDSRNGRRFTVSLPVVVRDPGGCPTCV